jgi:DASH complex subunit ASK1
MQEESAAEARSPQFGNTSPSALDETITSPGEPTTHQFSDDDDMLSSPSLAGRHSTPRMPSTATKTKKPIAGLSFAEDYPSPYEALKREVDGKPERSGPNPATPGRSALPDMTMTPQSSPFAVSTIGLPTTATKNKDTILHQGILNRTYRVAATPHTGRKQQNVATTPGTVNRTRRLLDFDETLSSPLEEAPAPRLRKEIFSSPVKAPRTPGVSVQTPGYKRRAREEQERNTGAGATAEVTRGRTGGLTGRSTRAWESDDDDDDDLDMSPPKTIMFNLPESRVLQTPGECQRGSLVFARFTANFWIAQEASRRIVEDIMYSAGGDFTDEIEDSPSIVQRNHELDETF